MTTTTLMRPAQWAQSQFSSAKLGDRRRTQRLVKIATHLAQSPGGTLPQAFPEWSELKAAYRFFNQPKITFEEIQKPHWQQTRAACQQPGQYLLIEDTSILDFSDHPATEEMGPIPGDGRGRGLLLHTTLALRIEGWDVQEQPLVIALGLLSQQCWSRWGRPSRREETRRQLMSRARESQRWALALEEGGPPAGSTWIYVADRESDFYEPIERCQRRGADFVIRGFHDRVLSQGEGHLKVEMAKAPLLGRLNLQVRARAGRASRMAQIEVRTAAVSLNGPRRLNGKQPDFQLNAVEVRENNAPSGAQPLHWLLLTSLPCDMWTQVQRVIAIYTLRWCVEEYHKALKSGAGAEDSQMERAYRIESLLGVLGIVAVRLFNTKWLARTRPDEPVSPKVFGAELLALLTAKFGKPQGGWTHRTALVSVARVGGFLARRSDGMPGWQTIWRGWNRLIWMCHGLETLKNEQESSG
jgi:Transposase DNA-binding/Transposase DDE domain